MTDQTLHYHGAAFSFDRGGYRCSEVRSGGCALVLKASAQPPGVCIASRRQIGDAALDYREIRQEMADRRS